MTRILALFAALSLAVAAGAGCFDIEEKVTLKKDLSGTASVNMKVDMEPMVYFVLAMGKGMQASEKGEEAAEVTPAEFAKAKKEFIAEQKKKMKGEKKKARDKVKAGLPEGVTLEKFDLKAKDLVFTYLFKLKFKHISQLAKVEFEGEQQQGGPKNPVSRPFEHLQIQEDEKTLTITSTPPNPAEGAGGGPPPDEGPKSDLVAKIESSMKDMSVRIQIEAPFEVIEHNATKTKGKGLTWEYDFAALEEMSKTGKAGGIKVKFKKK